MRFFRLSPATCLLALGLSASAQHAAPPSPAVALHVVVTQGNNGQPIPGLGQSSFTVLDNGVPQTPTSFHAVAGPGTPVQVLLVIDAVNLNFTRLAYEREELGKFLRANGGKLAQPTALAVFTDNGTQIQPGYSTDGNALADLLDKQVIGLRDIRRSAGFYGAEERLDLSLKTLGELLQHNTAQPGRKLVLWITPGWPLFSGPGVQLSSKQQQGIYNQVVAINSAVRQGNTTLYVVDPLGAAENPGRTFYFEEFVKGLRKPSNAEAGDLGVEVLAVQSGGLFLAGSNDVASLLTRCYNDASAYYDITYTAPPADAPTSYHKVEVRMAEPHMAGRALQGYYSSSDTGPR